MFVCMLMYVHKRMKMCKFMYQVYVFVGIYVHMSELAHNMCVYVYVEVYVYA